jgi:DegV family protein with EDD domain
MMPIALVTDTACDLPAEALCREGVEVVPMLVRFGDEVWRDGELDREAFWQRAQHGPGYPTTSQPSVGAFEAAFADWVERGYQVLCPVISSRISGTFQSAWTAAQRFGEHVTVWDTRAWSVAEGVQVLAALRAIAEGLTLHEVLARLGSIRARTHIWLTMATLTYARRGGRFHSVFAGMARMADYLSIKPIIGVTDGAPFLAGVARSMGRAVERIRREITQLGPAEALFVGHTRAPERAADLAALLARELDFPLDQVLVAELGPALASHGGPGALAGGIVPREPAVARG